MTKNRAAIYIAYIAAIIVAAAVAIPLAIQYYEGKNLAKDVAIGSALYRDNCASCHGSNLEGQPEWRSPDANGLYPAPPHNDDGHTWHHADQLLYDYTNLGGAAALQKSGVDGFESGMPAFGETLSEAEIWAVLTFIKSRWSDRNRLSQQERTKTDEEIDQ